MPAPLSGADSRSGTVPPSGGVSSRRTGGIWWPAQDAPVSRAAATETVLGEPRFPHAPRGPGFRRCAGRVTRAHGTPLWLTEKRDACSTDPARLPPLTGWGFVVRGTAHNVVVVSDFVGGGWGRLAHATCPVVAGLYSSRRFRAGSRRSAGSRRLDLSMTRRDIRSGHQSFADGPFIDPARHCADESPNASSRTPPLVAPAGGVSSFQAGGSSSDRTRCWLETEEKSVLDGTRPSDTGAGFVVSVSESVLTD